MHTIVPNDRIQDGSARGKRTHSLFIDDLKVYQESHQQLVGVNEMLVQASHDRCLLRDIKVCRNSIRVWKDG